jgi:KDO2-lipid IV(A) lauroyltransferase
VNTQDPIKGTVFDWIADRILSGMIAGLLKLPYETRLRITGQTMRYVLGPIFGYRRRAMQNLALVYPQMPVKRRREIANACCDNFGRTFIENYAWQEFGDVMARFPPTGPGLEPLAKAVQDKRPVLFVGGHFGNHEAPRRSLAASGYQVAVLYRPMKNPYFNQHYAETMAHWGGPAYAQGSPGTKQFIHHLRDGGLATLLFDVSTRGASIPFLGHPARTSLSTADFALEFDALVLPYFAVRQPDGVSLQVEVQSPIPHTTPTEMVAEMTARLEEKIAQYPAQWFWVHRRWK